MNNQNEIYVPKPMMSIREAAESAIKVASATGKNVIVEINEARFSVNGDTKVQDAIDAYMEVKRKMFETEQKLKQKRK